VGFAWSWFLAVSVSILIMWALLALKSADVSVTSQLDHINRIKKLFSKVAGNTHLKMADRLQTPS
jgi:hypothetical protein